MFFDAGTLLQTFAQRLKRAKVVKPDMKIVTRVFWQCWLLELRIKQQVLKINLCIQQDVIHLCWSQSISFIFTCTGDPIWLLHIFRMGGENYQLGTCCHLNLGRQASKCSGKSGSTDSLNPKCLGWRHVQSIRGNVSCSFISLGGRTTRLDFVFAQLL